VQHCQRNWKAERSREVTSTFLSHLTHPLRWMATNLSLSGIAAITPQAWYAYLDDRLSEDISAISLNGNLRVLWGFLRFAQDQGLPVCERIFKVSKLHTGPRIPKDVPIEQLRTLLAEIERAANANHKGISRLGVMDWAWVLLMLHSGLRTGEIRALRFQDLDLAARKLKIEQSKGLKDRFVYFSQAVCEALEAYLAVRGPRDALPETVFVFRHQPLSRSYCGQRLHTYGKKCGVRITPHQLRHTCATLLLNERVPVISVQMLLGHQHVDTTMHYARLYDGTVAADYFKAMDRIKGLTTVPASEETYVCSPEGLIGLLAALRTSSLTEQQKEIVSAIQEGVYALVNSGNYVP
jgi:integrase